MSVVNFRRAFVVESSGLMAKCDRLPRARTNTWRNSHDVIVVLCRYIEFYVDSVLVLVPSVEIIKANFGGIMV